MRLFFFPYMVVIPSDFEAEAGTGSDAGSVSVIGVAAAVTLTTFLAVSVAFLATFLAVSVALATAVAASVTASATGFLAESIAFSNPSFTRAPTIKTLVRTNGMDNITILFLLKNDVK